MKIKLIDKNCEPYRAYATDSGMDLRARLKTALVIHPMQYETIPVGIAVEFELGYEGQIRPRSGLSKRGIIAATGTIDNDYRGEIAVTLINLSGRPVEVKPYDRIAQLVVAPVHIPEIEYVDRLSDSERGAKGFGSTGVS